MVHKKTALILSFIAVSLAGATILGVHGYAQSKPGYGVDLNAPGHKTQEECENATGMSCGYAMCDYIPEGQTYEQTCGKDFQKGWQPTTTPVSNYVTKEACEKATGASCTFIMCDYDCGEGGYREGWEPAR